MPYYATSEDGRYILIVDQDMYPESPRTWSNLGTMVYWHRNWILGDEHPRSGPEQWARDFAISLRGGKAKDEEWAEEAEDFEIWEVIRENAVILPLYVYEHGGVTMNTRGVSFPWDSGQVGWIYVTHKDVEAEYGDLSEETLKKAEEYLQQEVNTFDTYLTGQVYCYRIEDLWLGDTVSACCGVYADGVESLRKTLKQNLYAEWHPLIEELDWHDHGPRDTQRSPVIVVVRGGVVQGVYSEDGSIDVFVVDFDEEGGACCEVAIERMGALHDDVLEAYEEYKGRS